MAVAVSRQGKRVWNSKLVLTKMCDALLYLHFLSEKEDMYEGMVVEPNRCR
jgi:hypothetical protein